ncbi:MAG: hypothetical protein B7Y45_11835 [Sphingomonas sp. 28-66-16]|nr:MAG: hypothetical protein B7Y45_11835 [Sphingomonas sp. 28-66-16]
MHDLWFITNPGSGSSTEANCASIKKLLTDKGLTVVGETAFPEQGLPTPAMLDAAGADTAILFAGDGTINAAVAALDAWPGAILILPGGTMNMLAKALHGSADPVAIVEAAIRSGQQVSLPIVVAGEHRALVGLILGPAASWVRTRELVRAGRVRGLGRALALAWRRTFGRGIRLSGVKMPGRGAQAVLIRPDAGGLAAAAIDAREWRSIARLGWDWLTGDWLSAASVTQVHAKTLRIAGSRPVRALFDGEPQMLDPSVPITTGETRCHFIRTLQDA